MSRRYGVHASQIYKWKRQFLENVASMFERDTEACGTSETRGRAARTDEVTTAKSKIVLAPHSGSDAAESINISWKRVVATAPSTSVTS